jgi:ribonuclease HI
MAISYLLDVSTSKPQVFILSDSKLVIDLLNRVSFSYEFEHLIVQVLSLRATYSSLTHSIRFCWVPGHVGLAGNEVADSLANTGSSITRSVTLRIPTNNEHFEYSVSDDTSPP